MSHSSGYGVQVSAAELQRRRDVDESRSRCAELHRRAVEAAAAAGAAGGGFVSIPDLPEIDIAVAGDAAIAIASGYERRIRAAHEEISDTRTQAVLAAFDSQVPSQLSGTITVKWTKREDLRTSGASKSSTTALDSNDRARNLLALLASLEDPARRNELFTAVVKAVGSPEVSLRLSELVSDVDAAFREQSAMTVIRNEADELIATLRAYDSPAARRARRSLMAASTRKALKSAASLARSAREAAEMKEQEDFVVEQAAVVLRELGYDVDDSFVEIAERGEFAVATNQHLGAFGLQVRLLDGGKRLITNTVALAEDTTHDQDVAAEERVCSDLSTIAERLGRRGVRLDRFFESKPGEIEIERRLDVVANPATQKTNADVRGAASGRSTGLESLA